MTAASCILTLGNSCVTGHVLYELLYITTTSYSYIEYFLAASIDVGMGGKETMPPPPLTPHLSITKVLNM